MGVPEIARRFIGGAWQTGVAEDPSGGSQPGAVIEYAVPFAFNTPDILTGLTLWEGVAGQRVGNLAISVVEAFDGTTPTGNMGIDGEDLTGVDVWQSADLSTADTFYDDSATLENVKISAGVTIDEGLYFVAAGTLVVVVMQNGGGDPNDPDPMTQGQAIARFQITEPTTP